MGDVMKPAEEAYWKQFKEEHNLPNAVFGSAWAFGASASQADELAQLTLTGEKNATASAYELYQLEGEPLPTANSCYDILLDGSGNPVAVLCTKEVSVVPYHKVDSAHAYAEGEGDKSLETWRRTHEEFFQRDFPEVGENVDFSRLHVVLEKFEVVYALPLAA